MASINALPIELLHKIVDLTVEDAIALRGGRDDRKQEQLRRDILIRLALVSKDFTRPAQLALWRYMERYDFVRVVGLIEAGFGKDKVIEELRICISLLPEDEYELFNRFLSFLRGVKRVSSITYFTIFGFDLRFDEFFEIDSIQGLNSLVTYPQYASLPLSVNHSRLPSQLRHLTIQSFSKEIDDVVSGLIESSSSTLTSIKLHLIKSDEYFGSTFASVLTSLAPKLQRLEIIESDNSILSSLVPHCTSLKSFSIGSNVPLITGHFRRLINSLNLLPKSVILESFSLLIPDTTYLILFPFIIPLLKTSSTFIRLNAFNFCFYDLDGDSQQDLENFYAENKALLEVLKKRGTSLDFGTEEQVRCFAERKKQKSYRESQKILDLVGKEEIEE